jgi:hypothetical protein
MRLLLATILSPLALLAGLIPSQKDVLTKNYLEKVRPPYTLALRNKDTDAFKASVSGMQELGQEIVAANSRIIVAAKRYTSYYYYYYDRGYYPPEIKTYEAARAYTRRMEAVATGLETSNLKLTSFKGVEKMTPESIRETEAYLNLLTKEIEVHHIASMAVR